MHLFAFVDVDRVVYCDVYKTDRPQPFIDIGAVHPKVYKAQHPIQQKFIHGEISFDEYKRMVGKLFDDEIWKEDIKIENDLPAARIKRHRTGRAIPQGSRKAGRCRVD